MLEAACAALVADAAARQEQIDLGLGQLPRNGGHLVGTQAQAAWIHDEVLALDESQALQFFENRGDGHVGQRHGDDRADAIGAACLLRESDRRKERGGGEGRHDLPPPHPITSRALATPDVGRFMCNWPLPAGADPCPIRG